MARAVYHLRKLFWFIIRPKTFGTSVVVRCGNEVLLADYTYGHGWNFPTASMRDAEGESHSESAQRFLREEFALGIPPPLYLGTRYCRFEYRRDTIFCFLIQIESKNVQVKNPKIRTASWFPIDHLPKNLSPFAREIVDTYFRKIRLP